MASWRWTHMDELIMYCMSFCVFQWADHARRLLISTRRHGDPRADRAEEEEDRGGHGRVSVALSHCHSSAAVLISINSHGSAPAVLVSSTLETERIWHFIFSWRLCWRSLEYEKENIYATFTEIRKVTVVLWNIIIVRVELWRLIHLFNSFN